MFSNRYGQSLCCIISKKIPIHHFHEFVKRSGGHFFEVQFLEYLPSVNFNVVDKFVYLFRIFTDNFTSIIICDLLFSKSRFVTFFNNNFKVSTMSSSWITLQHKALVFLKNWTDDRKTIPLLKMNFIYCAISKICLSTRSSLEPLLRLNILSGNNISIVIIVNLLKININVGL